MRTSEFDRSKKYQHFPDVYFIFYGSKGSTRQINLNNYELSKKEFDMSEERYFEFKSDDIGKVEKINLSIAQNQNFHDYLYVDFIEVKIPAKSEAYK